MGERLQIDRGYLIIAPNQNSKGGYHHRLTERAYLIDNILNFMENHPEVHPHQITVYELREINEHFELSITEEKEGI